MTMVILLQIPLTAQAGDGKPKAMGREIVVQPQIGYIGHFHSGWLFLLGLTCSRKDLESV